MLRVACVLFCLLAASTTRAESVAILGLEADSANERAAANLSEALRSQLTATGRTALPGKDFVEMRLVFGCTGEADDACMAQAGRSLGVDRLIYGSLKPQAKSSSELRLSIRLLDVQRATVVRRLDGETVARADLEAETSAGTAAYIISALYSDEPAATIEIITVPPGAPVTVNNQPRGPSPLTVTGLATGTHTVVATMEGFLAARQEVQLRAGQKERIKLRLVRDRSLRVADGPPAKASARGRGAVIAGAVLLGVGALAGGGAIATWRLSLNDARSASVALARLAEADSAYANATPNRPFFGEPDSCQLPGTAPSSGAAGQAADDYQNLCTRGRNLNNISNGLWAGAGALAISGITSLVVGLTRRPSAQEKRAHGFAPRLQAIAPTAGPRGAGLTASFEF